MNIEDVFLSAETINLRRWNKLKIQMCDLESRSRLAFYQVLSRSKSRLDLDSRFHSHFLNLVRDLSHKKCIIIAPPPKTTHTNTNTHIFLILSLSMTSWRGMWHIWYINVASGVYSCTLFKPTHFSKLCAFLCKSYIFAHKYSASFVTLTHRAYVQY